MNSSSDAMHPLITLSLYFNIFIDDAVLQRIQSAYEAIEVKNGNTALLLCFHHNLEHRKQDDGLYHIPANSTFMEVQLDAQQNQYDHHCLDQCGLASQDLVISLQHDTSEPCKGDGWNPRYRAHHNYRNVERSIGTCGLIFQTTNLRTQMELSFEESVAEASVHYLGENASRHSASPSIAEPPPRKRRKRNESVSSRAVASTTVSMSSCCSSHPKPIIHNQYQRFPSSVSSNRNNNNHLSSPSSNSLNLRQQGSASYSSASEYHSSSPLYAPLRSTGLHHVRSRRKHQVRNLLAQMDTLYQSNKELKAENKHLRKENAERFTHNQYDHIRGSLQGAQEQLLRGISALNSGSQRPSISSSLRSSRWNDINQVCSGSVCMSLCMAL